MKKTTLLFLSIVCVCCFVFGLTACNQQNKPTDSSSIQSDTTNSETSGNQGQEPNSSNQGQTPNSSSSSGGGETPPIVKHEHKYGDWLFDETNHWKECTETNGECDAKIKDLAKHTLNSETNVCTVCGQTIINAQISFTEIKEGENVVAYSVSKVAPENATFVNIPSKHNEKPVTSIGVRAFADCYKLTKVTLPDSIITIDASAFNSCRVLTSITLPNSVTSIGENAFAYCESLTSLTLPDSVTSIIDGAFAGCKNLTSITIPDSVNSIGAAAFQNCKNLTNITIGNGITTIGRTVFGGCTSLTNVILPNSVTRIGIGAFSGCTSLTSITIPDSVTAISYEAFSGCESLTSITLPDGVKSIGYEAFYGCTSLTSITLPDSVTSIGGDAFEWCPLLKYNEYDNALYLGNDTNPYLLLVKAKNKNINSCNINNDTKLIYQSAFFGCESLTSITIPDSVSCIDSAAFQNCKNLTSITIGKSVTTIGDYAFYECPNITSVTMGKSVTYIGEQAFENCVNLTSITIPENVTSIGRNAFDYCYKLVEIYNLSSLDITINNINIEYGGVGRFALDIYKSKDTPSKLFTTKEEYIFYENGERVYLISYVGKETKLVLPNRYNNKNYAINQYAFYNNKNITDVILSDSITYIGRSAFEGCTGLTSITIPDSVTTIDNYAFRDCTSLISVTIGSGVTYIYDSAFWNCYKIVEVYNLSSLNVTKGEPYNNGGVGCYALYVYNLKDTPSKLSTTSDGYVFYENGEEVYLIGYKGTETNLVLPDKFNNKNYTIHQFAFYSNESITSVTIPNSVISIGSYAFSGCTGLTSVTFADTANWSVSNGSTTKNLSLTDSSANATYLTDTYYNYYWKKTI